MFFTHVEKMQLEVVLIVFVFPKFKEQTTWRFSSQ